MADDLMSGAIAVCTFLLALVTAWLGWCTRKLVTITRRTEAQAVRPKVTILPEAELQGGTGVLYFRLRNLSQNEALDLDIDPRPAGAKEKWGCLEGIPYTALEPGAMTEGSVIGRWKFVPTSAEPFPSTAKYFVVALSYKDVMGDQHKRVYWLWGDGSEIVTWPEQTRRLTPVLQDTE